MPETLEQLDLLFLTVPTARKVHPDGIRFQGLRHIDTPLAAYIGESVVLRYDPRDAAEVRVFYNDCRFHLNRRLRGSPSELSLRFN